MNKYILIKSENQYFMRYANTDFHRGMVFDGDETFGGGMFTFDYENEEMILWGMSDDFGEPRFDKINDIIHVDDELKGWKIFLGNIRPSMEKTKIDITDKFVFDQW